MGLREKIELEDAMEIMYYDEFWNIPTRGIMRGVSGTMAFSARILDEEPPELSHLRGVYSEITGFICDNDLINLFAEKDLIFRTWRKRFDAAIEDTSTHPLYIDKVAVQFAQVKAA